MTSTVHRRNLTNNKDDGGGEVREQNRRSQVIKRGKNGLK